MVNFSVSIWVRQQFFDVQLRTWATHLLDPAMIDWFHFCTEDAVDRSMVRKARFTSYVWQLTKASSVPQNSVAPAWQDYWSYLTVQNPAKLRHKNPQLKYHAGVLLFSFWFMSSPAYLSELFEYLYVGGKYIFPSFHPTNTLPPLCSILSWKCQVFLSLR